MEHETELAHGAVEVSRGGLVTVVGSINADIVLRVAAHPLPGETVIGKSIAVHPGGKGANQAVAAARLGARVAFVGAVGDDAYAETATSGLREAGVDATGIVTVPGPTGQAFVTVDERTAENSIVVIPGANAHVDRALIEAQSGLLEKSAILVLQGEVPAGAAVAAAAESPARLVLNLAPVIPLERQLILRADPLVVNQHEGRLALEMLGRETAGLTSEEGVLEALLEEGIGSVVITLGAVGAVFSDGDSTVRVPAPRVEPVDTTGAGDAFVGALSARLAVGASLSEAVTFAVRVGSYAVCRAGAQPSYPWRGDRLPEGTA
ncbi:ribokinase [Sinomonas terrae]|uniref:Ribokinase n=1 Tax=Sinomonas terrae TaxID=2908838 RepID=A0ABS9TVK5_9MICC|nr:ribokinase [Sinomonas terrae]MCH6468454.1 ribokinase [Sinomonas terrae]